MLRVTQKIARNNELIRQESRQNDAKKMYKVSLKCCSFESMIDFNL